MKRTSSSLLKRSVRFGTCAGAVTFALAIAGGSGAYALTSREATVNPPIASSAHTAGADGRTAGLVPTPSASDLPSEFAQALPQLTPPEPDRPPAVVVTPAATPSPVLTPEARTAAPPERPAVVASTPAAAAEPRVEASRETLYGTIAAAFPEQPDKAYRVVMCESEGYAATNTGNGYYGLWQFDLPTWRSVGGTGLPSDASAAEQVMRARMLYDARGWSPWGCA